MTSSMNLPQLMTVYYCINFFIEGGWLALSLTLRDRRDPSLFFGDWKIYYTPAIYATCALATSTIVLSLLGYAAKCRKSLMLMNSYIGLSTIVIILDIAVFAIIHKVGSIFKYQLNHNMHTTMFNYFISTHDRNGWEHIQSEYKCCGIDSASDWGVASPNYDNQIWLPQSCYFSPTFQLLYANGCEQVISNAIQSTFALLLSTLFYFGFMNFIGVWLTVLLRREVKRNGVSVPAYRQDNLNMAHNAYVIFPQKI